MGSITTADPLRRTPAAAVLCDNIHARLRYAHRPCCHLEAIGTSPVPGRNRQEPPSSQLKPHLRGSAGDDKMMMMIPTRSLASFDALIVSQFYEFMGTYRFVPEL